MTVKNIGNYKTPKKKLNQKIRNLTGYQSGIYLTSMN